MAWSDRAGGLVARNLFCTQPRRVLHSQVSPKFVWPLPLYPPNMMTWPLEESYAMAWLSRAGGLFVENTWVQLAAVWAASSGAKNKVSIARDRKFVIVAPP
jgi:hypothetical protein